MKIIVWCTTALQSRFVAVHILETVRKYLSYIRCKFLFCKVSLSVIVCLLPITLLAYFYDALNVSGIVFDALRFLHIY